MKFIPAICWFILTLVLLTLPGSAFPKKDWLNNIQFDKMVHIGLFSLLVFFFFLPILKNNSTVVSKKKWVVRLALLALVYGIIMEFVQKFWIPNRSFDLYDIVADGVGSFLPVLFCNLLLKWGSSGTIKNAEE